METTTKTYTLNETPVIIKQKMHKLKIKPEMI